jgi:predicted MPP superfamily phosphohydrolase
VNNTSDEAVEWIDVFKQIKAKNKVFSTLGNHDYGDYAQWSSEQEKQANLNQLIQYHADMGWDLLLDEHRILEKDGEKIAVLGIQNWSAKKNFPKYGNLEKAYKGTEDIPVKLLLSHDPSHWRAQVLNHKSDIKAMFSGHTHGMQFGIDTRFYKWSPVKFIYDEWIDLYTENNQHLYVNRGFGYLGYPGRMGIFPEISVFTLA